MKRLFQSLLFATTLGVLVFLTSCGKNNTPPGTPGGGGGFTLMYPVSISVSQDNSPYPRVTKYEYDSKNLLVKYGFDSVVHEISIHGKNLTTYTYPYVFLTSYAFKMYNQLDTSVNIYTGAPTEVSVDFFTKRRDFGTTTSTHQGDILRENTTDGLLTKEIISTGGGENINYSYDDKKNLKEIDWIYLTGPRTLAPSSRLTIIGVDDKLSPFAAVQGYSIASYPQAYSIDYAWAYCKNNPTQIKVESYDADKNAMVLYEQDDYTYTYNDNGYPTTIQESITYYTGTTSHYSNTYSITYK